MQNSDILMTVAEASSFAASLMFLFKSNETLAKARGLLQYLETARVFENSELYEILRKGLLKQARRELHKFQDSGLASSFFAFVQGSVDARTPKQGLLDKNAQLIMSHKIVEPIFSNSNLIYQKEKLVWKQNKKKFFITDLNGVKVQVLPTDKTNFNNSMTYLNEDISLHHYFQAFKVFIFLIGLVKFLLKPLRLNSYLRGFRLGYKSTEFGLRVGDNILAYGKFLFDHQTNQLTMVRPLYMLSDKSQILIDQKNEIQKWVKIKLISIVMVLVSGGLIARRVSFLLIRLFKRMKRYFSLPRKLLYQTINQFYCVNCKQNPKSVIFKPCFHWAYCQQCAEQIQSQVCPICDKEATSRFDVFVV